MCISAYSFAVVDLQLIVENLRNEWAIGTSDANSSTKIAVKFTDGSPEQHIWINLSMPVGLVFGLAAVEGGKSLDGHVLKLGDQDLALEVQSCCLLKSCCCISWDALLLLYSPGPTP